MKKSQRLIPLFLLFSGALCAAEQGGFKPEGHAPAASEQKSGYRGINDTVEQTTVAQLSSIPDGRWVSLKGNIVKQLSNGHYAFRDPSGTITISVEKKVWSDQEVKPDDLVTLSGKLIKNGGKARVEVGKIRRL